ncbi:hypothetical protein SAMN04488570_0466 [Nocardioides scoriae]|uniref:YtxH-like protein n=1 Tax=Nocardioides scoriae TaxID=642780 RepID=A0A1H1M4U1_9ACTN|nr:hypothetical protein [Nocardioides scoriae]SDR81707.1 hypothetical protein SAMN04488570_0466 [Nocardioides scoriae]
MINKLALLAAGGVGYVLGAKAGRERYEQLRESYEKVKNDPRVQEKAQQAVDIAREKAPVVKEKVAETAGAAKDAAQDKVAAARSTSSDGAASEADADGELNPDRLELGEDTGPRGDLP